MDDEAVGDEGEAEDDVTVDEGGHEDNSRRNDDEEGRADDDDDDEFHDEGAAAAAAPALPSFSEACRSAVSLSLFRVVVKAELRLHPNYLETRDAQGRLPLHRAIGDDAPLAFLQHLIRLRPDTVKIELPPTGILALHQAILWERPDDVVLFFLQEWPEAAAHRPDHHDHGGDDEEMALHMALLDRRRRCRLQRETLRRLIQAAPEALRVRDRHGRPIVNALLAKYTGVSVAEVADFVDPYPEGLTWTDLNGKLPLHMAAANCDVRVLRYLVQSFPAAVRSWAWLRSGITDWIVRGELPIHAAVRSGSRDKIQCLLEHWPESIREADGLGRLPALIAAQRGIEPEAFRFVVERWRPALRVRDAQGLLPVHWAAKNNGMAHLQYLVEAWPESIHEEQVGTGAKPLHAALSAVLPAADAAQYLMDRDPEALAVADRWGKLPLHRAAVTYVNWGRHDRAVELVRMVFERYPDAIRVPDRDGNLPLHDALSMVVPFPVVRFLIEQDPASLRQRNGKGLLPVQVVMARTVTRTEDIRFLIDQCPESLQDRDPQGRVLLHFALDLTSHRHDDRLGGFHGYLMDKWPAALGVRDASGLLPFHVATLNSFTSLDLLYTLVRRRPDLLLFRSGGDGVVSGGEGKGRASGRSEPDSPSLPIGRGAPPPRPGKKARRGVDNNTAPAHGTRPISSAQ